MNKKITRIISLLMALLLMLSVAGCKETKTGDPADSSQPTVSGDFVADPESIPEIPDDNWGDGYYPGGFDIPSDPFTDDFGDPNVGGDSSTPEGGFDVQVERPSVEGYAISSGIKIGYAGDEEIEDPDIPGGGGDEFEIPEIPENDEYDFEALIQKAGKKVSGKTRQITVDNSKDGIVFTNFDGLSCNVFPTQSTLFSQQKENTAEAFLPMNGKRFNDIAPRYARSWFQIDWIVTNEAGDDYKKYADDWDSNPDYVNYYNGVYCFSDGQEISDELNSAIDYYKMLEQAGTEIYLAFGWKVGTRVQDWFGNTPTRQNIAAPRDLKQYAKAAAALFRYMRKEVGLTNFNTLSFYNEPDTAESFTYQGSWDYVTIGDKCSYWAAMARAAQKEFDSHKDLKDVLIMGPDSSRALNLVSDNLVNSYIAQYATDCVDAYTLHFYGYSASNARYYDTFFEECVFAHNFYANKPVYLTEYYVHEKDIIITEDTEASSYAWLDDIGWNASHASFFIGMANTGINGGFKWSYVGGRLIEPTSFFVGEGETASWYHPRSVDSINNVKFAFYEESMLNSYVKEDSNVHQIEWTGDDIRAAAFTSKNGKEFSLVVEANEKSKSKTLDISLEESLGGKDVYLYWFNHKWEKDGNAIIPPCQDVLKGVTDRISYDINGEYGIYIFTTIPPVKQVAVFDKEGNPAAGVECEIGEEITISSQLIDCDAADKVEWELVAYDAGPLYDTEGTQLKRENCLETGTYAERCKVTDNGDGTVTVKITDKATQKDVLALKCTIVDGDKDINNDRYAISNIIII